MSKKLDLNTYLNKYITTQEGRHNESMNKTNPNDFHSARGSDRGEYEEDYRGQQVQHHTAGFQKAQLECLEEIQEMRRVLVEEEKQINFFLSNYHKRVAENLHREHHRIRAEVLEMFQRSFEANEKRIDESLTANMNADIPEFVQIRRRMAQINQDLARLEQGLRSQNYRAVIAEVVTSDFDAVAKELQQSISATERLVYEKSPKLRVNQHSLSTIRDELMNIVLIDKGTATKQEANMAISNQRPDSRKHKGLEGSQAQDKHSQKGSFFNFK